MRTLRGVGRLVYQAKDIGETDYTLHIDDQVGFGVKSARGELSGNAKAYAIIIMGANEAELRLMSGRVVKIILTKANLGSDSALFNVNGEFPD